MRGLFETTLARFATPTDPEKQGESTPGASMRAVTESTVSVKHRVSTAFPAKLALAPPHSMQRSRRFSSNHFRATLREAIISASHQKESPVHDKSGHTDQILSFAAFSIETSLSVRRSDATDHEPLKHRAST
jgi:hypothetical protein